MSIEKASTVVLTVVAMIMGAIVVRREFAASPLRMPVPRMTLEARRVSDSLWGALLANAVDLDRGHTDPDAPITLVAFTDLECLACRHYHQEMILGVGRRFGGTVRVAYLPLPLRNHRFALQAAQAAECAGAQERFEEFVHSAFAKQDSIGLKSWASYGVEAGVPDLPQFERCLSLDTHLRIDAAIALANSLGVRATPTVIVNGWLFNRPLSEQDLRVVVDNLVADRPLTSELLEGR